MQSHLPPSDSSGPHRRARHDFGSTASIGVIWLIDMDPPSDLWGDDRGFFPASIRTDPPDEALMRGRLDAVFEAINAEVDTPAVVTVHTSPRHRETFLREPYLELWQRFGEAGVGLALHPHEERIDGSTLYDDEAHLREVVASATALAGRGGLHFRAFRSGTFSFHPALPAILTAAGIEVDLSAAPTLSDPRRSIDWPARTARADAFLSEGIRLVEVPIGWDGEGSSLDANYLFNERMDLAGLIRVWERIRARAEISAAPLLVNFLCHGFGLVDARWRRQATDFIGYVVSHGGHLVGIDDAAALLSRQWGDKPRREAGIVPPADSLNV